MQNPLSVRTDLRAGYRPVQTMVYPNQWGYWTPGWFDLDSLTLCGSPYSSGGSVGAYSAMPGESDSGVGAPPPPPAP